MYKVVKVVDVKGKEEMQSLTTFEEDMQNLSRLFEEYRSRIEHLEKSDQLYRLLSHLLEKRASVDSQQQALLRSLERAVGLQREDASRLQAKIDRLLRCPD